MAEEGLRGTKGRRQRGVTRDLICVGAATLVVLISVGASSHKPNRLLQLRLKPNRVQAVQGISLMGQTALAGQIALAGQM